jgi:hypothetical protein
MLWRRQTCPSLAGNGTTVFGYSDPSVVTALTELPATTVIIWAFKSTSTSDPGIRAGNEGTACTLRCSVPGKNLPRAPSPLLVPEDESPHRINRHVEHYGLTLVCVTRDLTTITNFRRATWQIFIVLDEPKLISEPVPGGKTDGTFLCFVVCCHAFNVKGAGCTSLCCIAVLVTPNTVQYIMQYDTLCLQLQNVQFSFCVFCTVH